VSRIRAKRKDADGSCIKLSRGRAAQERSRLIMLNLFDVAGARSRNREAGPISERSRSVDVKAVVPERSQQLRNTPTVDAPAAGLEVFGYLPDGDRYRRPATEGQRK